MLIITAIILIAAQALAAAPAVRIETRERFPLRAWVGPAPVPLQLDVVTTAELPAQNARIEAVLRDAAGAEVSRQSTPIHLDADEREWFGFALAPPHVGHYTVAVRVLGADGAALADWRTGIGVLRARPEPTGNARDSIFGVNVHVDARRGDQVTMLELMRRAGIRWMRDSIVWPAVERDAGVLDMPTVNSSAFEVARQRYGIQGLVVLCYGHPVHGNAPRLFGRYCGYVSARLRGIVDHFEIWNEPNTFGRISPEQYVGLLRAGCDAVKAANPDAVVVGVGGGSPGGWSGNYLAEIMRQDALPHMDTFSVHPYTSPWPPDLGYRPSDGATYDPSDLETLVTRLVNLDNGDRLTVGACAAIRQAKGLDRKPRIWATEAGYPSIDGHAGTGFAGQCVQAQNVMRLYLTAAGRPDLWERVFLYELICTGPSPAEMEHNFGLIGHDYSIRPAYVALATTSRHIDGRPFLGRVPCDDSAVRLYLFGPAADPVLAAWCTEVTPEELAAGGDAVQRARFGGSTDVTRQLGLTVTNPVATCWDWQDRAVPAAAADGRLSLTLTPWPVFVTGLGPAAGIAVQPRSTPQP